MNNLDDIKRLYSNKEEIIEKLKYTLGVFDPSMEFYKTYDIFYKILTPEEKNIYKKWKELQDKIFAGQVEFL